MVEAVHAARTHAFVHGIRVPTLPDGGCAVIDGVEPRWVLVLEEEFVGDVLHTVLGEGLHEDGCAEETCLQTVIVFLEVLAEAGYHGVLCSPLKQVVLEGEECRRLHRVEDFELERAVGIEEVLS